MFLAGLFAGLWLKTEFGRMQVSPGEIAVVQQGIRFAVGVPDGPSRGYVCEVFGGHFQLPELGPIGELAVMLSLLPHAQALASLGLLLLSVASL